MAVSIGHAELTMLVAQAREVCGCYACCGLREVGAHTIATPDKPRPTPSSCVANTLLHQFIRGFVDGAKERENG